MGARAPRARDDRGAAGGVGGLGLAPMVQIVCHKGANELRPENTRAAAQLCIDWGVDWVEVDVNTCVSQ